MSREPPDKKKIATEKILLLKIKLATTLNLFIVNLLKTPIAIVAFFFTKTATFFLCLISRKTQSKNFGKAPIVLLIF